MSEVEEILDVSPSTTEVKGVPSSQEMIVTRTGEEENAKK